jgi:hypothetical protein
LSGPDQRDFSRLFRRAWTTEKEKRTSKNRKPTGDQARFANEHVPYFASTIPSDKSEEQFSQNFVSPKSKPIHLLRTVVRMNKCGSPGWIGTT